MAEFRRPGVFVKEVPSIPPPPPAAPSALGIIGFTLKGPSNKAIRVESFDDFSDTFGGYTPLSMVPLELEKYFNNGGQVAYVVRVTPVGSQKAENRFTGSSVFANGLGTGNGTTTLFSGVIPNAPLARGRLAISVQGTGIAGPYTFTIPGAPKDWNQPFKSQISANVEKVPVNHPKPNTRFNRMVPVGPASSVRTGLRRHGCT